MKNYLLERLQEPSTWRGIIGIIIAIGATISPEMADSVIAVGLAVSGLVAVSTKG